MSVRTKFSFHTLSVRRGLVVASICAFAFFCIGAEPPPPRVLLSWERNWNDTTEFPVVQVDNQTDAAVESTLFFRMYDTDGNVLREEKQTISAPPGEKLSLDGLRQFPRPEKPVLVTVEGEKLHAANGGRRLPDREHVLSGIFGRPGRIDRSADRLISMNVHIERYVPELRWKLMQLLRKARVKSVRIDLSFRDPDDRAAVGQALNNLEEVVLGLEAFGIEPMVLHAWYPSSFYQSPEKMSMAYRWARLCAERFPHRVSWHYGNEMNSGWATYGAAADMSALHRAFALGTRDGDPSAHRGSFGIAEGLPGYTKQFLADGVGDLLTALCVHPYSGTPEAGVAKILANKALLNPEQEIWATECGYMVDETPGEINPLTQQITQVMGYSLELQAAFLSRLYVLGRSCGIDRIYWYDFYGLGDPENFWLVKPDLSVRSGYTALCVVAEMMEQVTPCGGTPLSEVFQRHYFRRPDGSGLAVLWRTDGKVSRCAVPGATAAVDAFNRPVPLKNGTEIPEIGALPIFVSVEANQAIADFTVPELIASPLDRRSFSKPMSRFQARPGEEISIPFNLFNASDRMMSPRAILLEGFPGWDVKLPEFESLPGMGTLTRPIRVKVPADAVAGVVYEFRFAAELPDGRRSGAFPVKIKIDGEFPYREIAAVKAPDGIRQFDPLRETQTGCGQKELTAQYGSAEIDGTLTEWKPGEFTPLNQKLTWILRDPELPDRRDFTVRVAFRWDEEFLYAAFLVDDDQLSLMDNVSRDWRDNDNLRLFLSREADPEKRSKQMSEDELLLILSATNAERTSGPEAYAAVLKGIARPGFESRLNLASRLWSGGYALEVAIPHDAWGVKAAPETLLGLNVLADDVDGGYRRHTAMTWFGGAEYWISPQTLGILRLAGPSEQKK